MRFFKDGNGSLCVEWEQAFGHCKRAWIQRKPDKEKDWAQTPERRYLNVVRVDIESGNPGGNPTDFPIFCTLSDRQILEAFVTSICAITGLNIGSIQSDTTK
jgi:hypothetical protein